MPIAGTNIPLNSTEGEDKITSTEKVTTTYLSSGATEITAPDIVSQSLSDDNEIYYFGVSNASTPTTPEFNIAYGNANGNGGNDYSDTVKSPAQAIYKQWSSLLLNPTEVTGGFFISRNIGLTSVPTNASIASGRDDEIFVLTGRRTLQKDRLNKKNWTIILSGSNSSGNALAPLYLTDDSQNDSPIATPAGDRYNIVSGSDGTVHTAATTRTFGYYYPHVGALVFSQQELSASIQGSTADVNDVVIFNDVTHKGFGTTNTNTDSKQALRFVNCLTSLGNANAAGAKLSFRDEEDQVSAQYFCRIKAAHCNFSNNPTFVSGSQNKLRGNKMRGNPQTFITGVQLYNDSNEIVAVANLSTPLRKNFSSEATVKVKLTY